MTDITEWWGSLMLVQQICLVIAVPATVILLIQTMMLLFGMDEEFNSDADASLDDGLTLFSVRGIVSMLCITGWSGYALLETPLPEWASVLIAVVLGIATLLVMAFLMRALQRLQSSGNIEIANAVGKVGQVYIPIPANASAAGKVNITVQEKYSEFSAITMGDEALPTGTYVRVVAVDDVGTLVVERLAGK